MKNAGASGRNITGKLGLSCFEILLVATRVMMHDDLLLIVLVSAYETLRHFSVLLHTGMTCR